MRDVRNHEDMNATDGFAHPSGSPPLQEQDDYFLTSRANKKRKNLGKSEKTPGLLPRQKSVGPQYQANSIDVKLPKQHTLAPGNNRRQVNLAFV